MKTAVVFLFCWTLAGQEPMPRMTKKTEASAVAKAPEIDFYDALSDYFRQSSRAVQALGQKGIPDAELAPLLYLARHSSASPNELVDAKKAGGSWESLAKKHNVKLAGSNFASDANIAFLSEYHGAKPEDIKAMLAKGTSFIAINQELRRSGASMKRKTEKAQ